MIHSIIHTYNTLYYVILESGSPALFQHLLCLPQSHQVPTILNALQRSVQAVLVGKIQIQDWFGNGIKRAALMNKWVLKEVAIDEDERCLLQTDGSFLYLLCKDGLYKVGSGYSGTVRVCITERCILSLLSRECWCGGAVRMCLPRPPCSNQLQAAMLNIAPCST